MGYRFSDTGKWQDVWFIDLDAHQKLMFLYLCDSCDSAGFYELSLRRLIFDLGLNSGEVKGALKGLEKAYILSPDKDVLFIKNFLKHQKNLPLNPLNKMHSGILKRFEVYKGKFDINLIDLVSKQVENKVKFMGQPAPNGNGNIISISNKGGAGGKIEFSNFWDLYGKKVGDKDKVEKKWDSLKLSEQQKIMQILPKWKSQFTERQYQPHPATFLNQKRWNDEILVFGVKEQVSRFPNEYSAKFEATLPMNQIQSYWAHLRSLGYLPKRNNQNTVVDWVKQTL